MHDKADWDEIIAATMRKLIDGMKKDLSEELAKPDDGTYGISHWIVPPEPNPDHVVGE